MPVAVQTMTAGTPVPRFSTVGASALHQGCGPGRDQLFMIFLIHYGGKLGCVELTRSGTEYEHDQLAPARGMQGFQLNVAGSSTQLYSPCGLCTARNGVQ